MTIIFSWHCMIYKKEVSLQGRKHCGVGWPVVLASAVCRLLGLRMSYEGTPEYSIHVQGGLNELLIC